MGGSFGSVLTNAMREVASFVIERPEERSQKSVQNRKIAGILQFCRLQTRSIGVCRIDSTHSGCLVRFMLC